jgi:putative hydrolase of the HAD superfamily
MIDTWIFDLDNTLYHPNLKIIDEAKDRYIKFLEKRLNYSREQALHFDKMLHTNDSAAAFGILKEHKITPEEFCEAIRGIDINHVPENLLLRDQLAMLPGRKYIFTNAPDFHAEALLNKLGIIDQFDDIYHIGNANFVTKPHETTYDNFISTYAIDPKRSIMFEDSIKNLQPAYDRGMKTVYVDYHLNERQERPNETYVNHMTNCLMTFLDNYTKGIAA